MGTIQHNAVIATTWDNEKFDAMIEWINQLSDREKELFVARKSWVNSYRTIILTPDGSKEGWPESDAGDNLRNRFLTRLHRDGYEDGGNCWDFVHIGYGELGISIGTE